MKLLDRQMFSHLDFHSVWHQNHPDASATNKAEEEEEEDARTSSLIPFNCSYGICSILLLPDD
jgi:hypothetical protein